MPEFDPTAATAGIKFLYHYQKFDPEHLTTVLRDHKIYCSDPSSMNDPWDFRPWFDHGPMLDNPSEMERMLEYFRSNVGDEVLNSPERLLFEEQLRQNPEKLREFMETFSVRLSETICKRRIYCLTPCPVSILMWAHYAQNHTGVCLEFSVNNQLIGAARPVKYNTDYPRWTPQTIKEEVSALILTKAMDWRYEREFRILVGEGPNFKGTPYELDGSHVHLPPGALTSVILGCEAKHALIENLIRTFAPGLPIKHARRVTNKYELEII
jgi:hypothetical protein